MARPWQKVIPANTVKNRGGTVVWGGNAVTTASFTGPAVTNVPGTDVTARNSGPHANLVPKPQSGADIAAGVDTSGTFQPIAAGDFASMVAGDYIMRGYSNYIAGVANTLLKSPANLGAIHPSIHLEESRRYTKIQSWDYATGVATKGLPLDWSFGTDAEAHPTAALPGELAYMVTGAVPTTDEYPARTQW